MIAKLRRRHRTMFPVLGAIVVTVIIFGLQELPEVENKKLPGYSNPVPGDLIQEVNFDDEWDDDRISSIVYFSEAEQAYYLHFIDRNYTSGADLLLYLNEDSSKDISVTSKLIGSFIDDNSAYYKLPSIQISNASIIIYSLPKKEVLAVATIRVQEDSQ